MSQHSDAPRTPSTDTEPFADRSVSFGLYAHDLEASKCVSELVHQSAMAIDAGFDGVTLSEHHAGYPGYVPNPLQMVGWLLPEMQSGWAAAMPVLLSLRQPLILAEEVSWLAARFPGRVGLGFASGYVEADFELAGSSFTDRHGNFRGNLEAIANGLRQPGPLLARDPAVLEFGASIPLVVAAQGPRALELSARLGMGIAGTSHWDEPTQAIHQQYLEFGGRGPRVIRRWIWLGSDTVPGSEAWVTQASAPKGDYSWVEPGARRILAHANPLELASLVAASVVDSFATCLSIRIHVPGMPVDVARAQLELLSEQFLPALREHLAGADISRTSN